MRLKRREVKNDSALSGLLNRKRILLLVPPSPRPPATKKKKRGGLTLVNNYLHLDVLV